MGWVVLYLSGMCSIFLVGLTIISSQYESHPNRDFLESEQDNIATLFMFSFIWPLFTLGLCSYWLGQKIRSRRILAQVRSEEIRKALDESGLNFEPERANEATDDFKA